MKKLFYPIILISVALTSTTFSQRTADYPESDYLKVEIIFTNDIHGGIDRSDATFINPDFPPKLGGGAVAGRYIFQQRELARKNGWGFLLLDAGDIYQGTPLGTLSEGESIIQYMNTVGYDAITTGNHDFDNGWKNLKKLSDSARFPFIAANLYRKSTGQLVEFVKPYIIKEIQGIKIGIVGIATCVTVEMSFPEHIEDIDFRSEIETLKEVIPQMRKEGAQIIICETHCWLDYDPPTAYLKMEKEIKEGKPFPLKGASAMEVARAVPGIDIMFTGHLHRGFYKPWEDAVNHTLIFQNYANGSNLGHVNFYIHRKTGTLAGYDFVSDEGAIFTLFEDDFLPDTGIAKQIDELAKKAEAGFDEVIGNAKGKLTRSNEGESSMGNFVVDAMRIEANADIGFSNHGGVRADLSAGQITPRDLFRVMPFGNRLVIFNVTGEFLKSLIEDRVTGNSRGMLVSGAKVLIDRRKPDGNRVVSFLIGDKPVDPKKMYRLAVSDYLAEGNSGFDRLTQIAPEHVIFTGTLLRQTMIDYVSKYSPVTSTLDGRWKEIK